MIKKQFLDVFLKIMSEWTGIKKTKRKKNSLFEKHLMNCFYY